MTPEEFQELRATFERILASPKEERRSILEDVSTRDPVLAAELDRMLAAHGERASVLDRPAVSALEPTGNDGLRPGFEIGSYRIEREIATGGMGVVYLATRSDGSFERKAAIKVLRRDRIDPLFLIRFHQERKILAQLNHPHIAAILDAGETIDGDPYFVMEYVDGLPITEFCERHGLSVDRRLDLFLQVCDALQHAHRNLTVHRDLKPSNVLVTAAGAVKLLDFGIAKLIERPEDPAPEMPASALILTPEYSSPEQIEREPVTTATDVFALGILLYELLSGEHPFRRKGRQPHEVMRAICEDDPPPPSAVAGAHASQIRGELDIITATALRKQPVWRYPSIEQLSEDVRCYLRGLPISAKGNGGWYRLRKFVRRQWMPLTAAALLLLSLTAGDHRHQLSGAARQSSSRGCRKGARRGRKRNEPTRTASGCWRSSAAERHGATQRGGGSNPRGGI